MDLTLAILSALTAVLWITQSADCFHGSGKKIPEQQETKPNYEINFVRCSMSVVDTDFFGKETECHITMFNETTPTIASTMQLLQPFTEDIMVKSSLSKFTTANTWMPMLSMRPYRACDHYEMNKSDFDRILEHSNITCPMNEGTYVAEDTGSFSGMAPNNLPHGRYLAQATLFIGDKILMTPEVQFTLDPVIDDYEE